MTSLVKTCIKELNRKVRKNPLAYISESDVQSELFAILLRRFNRMERVKNVYVWGTKTNGVEPVFSRQLHSEFLLPEGRIDLALLDLKKVRMAFNSRRRFGYLQPEESRKHVFIEIKSSRTNRSSVSSKHRWVQLVMSDIRKLNNYKNACFLICYDFDDLLGKADVSSLAAKAHKNVVVIYVRTRSNFSLRDVRSIA